MWSLVLLFWTSGDICPRFESQGGSLTYVHCCLCALDSSDSVMVWHLLTSCNWAFWYTYFFKHWWYSNPWHSMQYGVRQIGALTVWASEARLAFWEFWHFAFLGKHFMSLGSCGKTHWHCGDVCRLLFSFMSYIIPKMDYFLPPLEIQNIKCNQSERPCGLWSTRLVNRCRKTVTANDTFLVIHVMWHFPCVSLDTTLLHFKEITSDFQSSILSYKIKSRG